MAPAPASNTAPILALVGAADDARPALAKAVSEALIFSGLDAGELDVAFLAAGAPALSAISAKGLRFDLPAPTRQAARIVAAPSAPGMDPNRPPKLR